ncbi:hypothetical protein WAI453_002522 [Rhynchosporium graminicola]
MHRCIRGSNTRGNSTRGRNDRLRDPQGRFLSATPELEQIVQKRRPRSSFAGPSVSPVQEHLETPRRLSPKPSPFLTAPRNPRLIQGQVQDTEVDQSIERVPVTPTRITSRSQRRRTSLPVDLQAIRDQAFPEPTVPTASFHQRQTSPIDQSSQSSKSPSPRQSVSPKDKTLPGAEKLARQLQDKFVLTNRLPSPTFAPPTAMATVSVYTKNEWKSDAVFIQTLQEDIEDGGNEHLVGLILPPILRQAKALVRTLDPGLLADLKDKAIRAIGTPETMAIESTANFNTFLTRFQAGPPEAEMAIRMSSTPAVPRPSIPRTPGPVRSSIETEIPLPNRRRRNFTYGNNVTDVEDEEDSDPQDSGRQQQDSRPHKSSTQHRRLRPQDVGQFDGTTSVTGYIAMLNMMVARYGEDTVLEVLPICMKDKAAIWLSTLSPEITSFMSQSLEEWKHQLMLQFHTNPSVAVRKADALKHSFKDEKELSLRQFLDDKYNLYIEAGETNQDLIVRRMHQALDPSLAASVPLRDYGNTMNEFKSKIYNTENQAREAYLQTQSRIDEQTKEIQELRRLVTDNSHRQGIRRDRDPRSERQSQAPTVPMARYPTIMAPTQLSTPYSRPWMPPAEYAEFRRKQRQEKEGDKAIESTTLVPASAPTARRNGRQPYQNQPSYQYQPQVPVMINQPQYSLQYPPITGNFNGHDAYYSQLPVMLNYSNDGFLYQADQGYDSEDNESPETLSPSPSADSGKAYRET